MSDIRKAILITMAVSIIAACKKDPVPPVSSENPVFSLDLPSDYMHIPGHGIDTWVGYYAGQNGNIGYDCGYLSFGSLDDLKPTDCLYYEELMIEDTLAKIVMQERGSDKLLSLYIDKDGEWKKLRLYAANPSKENFFFFCKVFKSLKFK
jgi:hypothetical protein